MIDGSSTDHAEPAMPILDMSRYCGIARVMPGSSTPPRMAKKTTLLPRNRYLASA
jgi:hypothetical protein